MCTAELTPADKACGRERRAGSAARLSSIFHDTTCSILSRNTSGRVFFLLPAYSAPSNWIGTSRKLDCVDKRAAA
jgi:hypothetical protein